MAYQQATQPSTHPQTRLRASAVQTASTSGGKKEKPQESLELQFGRHLAKKPDFAQLNGVLYRWEGSHFQNLSIDECNRFAFNWLSTTCPALATVSKAESCVKTALMMIRPLPQPSHKQILVPFRNAYLLVNDQGTITRVAPDPQYGITGVIDADLPGNGSHYTPGPVPAGSYLDRYLNTSLPDKAVRDYLQEMAGDSLTPSIRFQMAALLKGAGRNGKSIFLRLLQTLHRQSNVTMRLQELRGFALSPLVGATLVTVDEMPNGKFDDQQFKSLISGDNVFIDRKNRDAITYAPKAKWFISTNHELSGVDMSHGFWRRLAIIPFDHRITDAEFIPGLDQKIVASEMIHFVDWCLEGLCRLNRRGQLPPMPASVSKAKQNAKMAANPMLAWIEDRQITKVASPKTIKTDIYSDYAHWCQANSARQEELSSFWKKLRVAFDSLEEKQSRCHRLQRLVNLEIGALQLGATPTDDEPVPFDED